MDLSDTINAYLRDRAARGVSKSTIYGDKQALQYLLADVGNISTARLRPQHLDMFWQNRTNWAPGTCNRAQSILSMYFKWCQNRGYLSRSANLLEDRKPLRVPPRKRLIIPQSDFSTFLEGDYKDPRTRPVLAIGLYLFLRRSEITMLRWQDWNEQMGTIEVFREKTKTLDTLPVCTELEHELKRWRLEYAGLVGTIPAPSNYIIPARNRPSFTGVGQRKLEMVDYGDFYPNTRARVDVLIKHALLKAGYFQPQEGGHTLRRSGAVALYNQLTSVGHDRAIRVCQAMLGHSKIATTEVYLRLDLDRKVRNDLLAGQPMFPDRGEGVVLELGDVKHGEGDARSVPL